MAFYEVFFFFFRIILLLFFIFLSNNSTLRSDWKKIIKSLFCSCRVAPADAAADGAADGAADAAADAIDLKLFQNLNSSQKDPNSAFSV